MFEDPIRNIQNKSTESVYSVQQSNEKSLKREKRKKQFSKKRKNDIVEISDDVMEDLSENPIDLEKTADHESSLPEQHHIDILVR